MRFISRIFSGIFTFLLKCVLIEYFAMSVLFFIIIRDTSHKAVFIVRQYSIQHV